MNFLMNPRKVIVSVASPQAQGLRGFWVWEVEREMKPLVGMVVSNKMQKSVVVAVDRLFHNKLYNRYVKRTSKFMAHDENNQCNIGDRVRVSFPRPSSLSLSLSASLIYHQLISNSLNFRSDWIHQGR